MTNSEQKVIEAARRMYPNDLSRQCGYVDAAMKAIPIIESCDDPATAYEMLYDIRRELFKGKYVSLSDTIQQKLVVCPDCEGFGRIEIVNTMSTAMCDTCDGTGVIAL